MPHSSKDKDAKNHSVDLVCTEKSQIKTHWGLVWIEFGLVLIHTTSYGNVLVVWIRFS